MRTVEQSAAVMPHWQFPISHCPCNQARGTVLVDVTPKMTHIKVEDGQRAFLFEAGRFMSRDKVLVGTVPIPGDIASVLLIDDKLWSYGS